ncbi:MAG: hypothetical protein DRJ52_02575 [Thermoprotei archaeon]|nr:MAG: hypothetical protein DRJ52_02575 [Thermoprotei archaeon]RLE99274.1 MAG: hypothetical protein DRJ63_05905 [Thermoprotei archaeon]
MIQIIIGGRGGQGIQFAGHVLARAACIYMNKYVIQVESYGAEARGGESRSEVIISDEEIPLVGVVEADYGIMLFQKAYDRYVRKMKRNGVIFADDVYVKKHSDYVKNLPIPAYKIALRIGSPLVMNIVSLGIFAGYTSVVSEEALSRAVKDLVRKEYLDLNLHALKIGVKYGRELREKKEG